MSIRHIRPELDSLKQMLYDKGATHILTYDDIADTAIRDRVKDWTGGKVCGIALIPLACPLIFRISKPIRLGLNCVGTSCQSQE